MGSSPLAQAGERSGLASAVRVKIYWKNQLSSVGPNFRLLLSTLQVKDLNSYPAVCSDRSLYSQMCRSRLLPSLDIQVRSWEHQVALWSCLPPPAADGGNLQ